MHSKEELTQDERKARRRADKMKKRRVRKDQDTLRSTTKTLGKNLSQYVLQVIQFSTDSEHMKQGSSNVSTGKMATDDMAFGNSLEFFKRLNVRAGC